MLIELTEHKKHMKEHKKEKKQLQDELMILQQTIREHQLPVIILFEGWSFSGKGTFISELMIHFDFRHLTMHNITPPTEEELRHPFLAQFLDNLPHIAFLPFRNGCRVELFISLDKFLLPVFPGS